MSKVMTYTSQRFVTYHFCYSFIRLNGLTVTFMYETWLGFRSASLSHDTKRNLKN